MLQAIQNGVVSRGPWHDLGLKGVERGSAGRKGRKGSRGGLKMIMPRRV